MKLVEYFEKRIRQTDGKFISYDELAEWPADQVEETKQQSCIVQTDDAEGVVCDQCLEGCWKLVEIRQKDGRKVGVIHCEDEDCAGLITVELERLQQWEIKRAKLVELGYCNEGEAVLKKDDKKQKKRPSKKEMETRNQAVAMVAAKFQAEHDRLPSVHDVVGKTCYDQKQIYQTDAYKEGKIAKKTAKVTDEMTGSSVTESEYFGENTIEHTRAKKRSKTEQSELDALIGQQQADDKSGFVK